MALTCRVEEPSTASRAVDLPRTGRAEGRPGAADHRHGEVPPGRERAGRKGEGHRPARTRCNPQTQSPFGTFARAVNLFGHQGVVNIASLIGDYAATAILLNVADQHVRDVSLLPVP